MSIQTEGGCEMRISISESGRFLPLRSHKMWNRARVLFPLRGKLRHARAMGSGKIYGCRRGSGESQWSQIIAPRSDSHGGVGAFFAPNASASVLWSPDPFAGHVLLTPRAYTYKRSSRRQHLQPPPPLQSQFQSKLCREWSDRRIGSWV